MHNDVKQEEEKNAAFRLSVAFEKTVFFAVLAGTVSARLQEPLISDEV